MNEMTIAAVKCLENCSEMIKKMITEGGHYRTNPLRNIAGTEEDVDLGLVHEAMEGEDLALAARDALMLVENRTPLAILCCEGPTDGFREWLSGKLVKDFGWEEDLSRFVAARMDRFDRRFKAVMDSLEDFADATVCGVSVDGSFKDAAYLYLKTAVHMKDDSLTMPAGKTAADASLVLETAAAGADMPGADCRRLFESIRKYDGSISLTGEPTPKSVKNHALRMATRLWYDTGVVTPFIEAGLKRNLCKVANSMRLRGMYVPMIRMSVMDVHGIRSCFESKSVMAERLERISGLAMNSLYELCSMAESEGADVGLMLRLSGYDEEELSVLRSFMEDYREYFANGFMSVEEDGSIVRKVRNSFGGTMLHDRTDSGATVANPVKRIRDEAPAEPPAKPSLPAEGSFFDLLMDGESEPTLF